MISLPHEAKVVVIGGGIAGCSTAYHLAENGWDTVLIEHEKEKLHDPKAIIMRN